MAPKLPFRARQLYSALRGEVSLSRGPPSLLISSSLTISTLQQAEYTQRAVVNGVETESDMPIVIASLIQYTKRSTDLEAIAQARQKIQKEPLHLSKEPAMISNKAGFDMFREFRAMNKSIDALKAELKTQQVELKTLGNRFDTLYNAKVRNGVIELIKRSGLPDRYITARNTRNQDTHGADIKFHRKLLDLPNHDEDISGACIKGFESTYGISSAVYDSHVHEAPNEIIQVANRRGDLCYLHIYTKSRHHQKEIGGMKRICDDILSLWVSQNETAISEEIRTKISTLEHLHKLWKEEKVKRSYEKRKGTIQAPL